MSWFTMKRSGRVFVLRSFAIIERRSAVASELRSKYVAIKTSLECVPNPSDVVDFIHAPKTQGGLGQPDAAVCWANHPAESGGCPHTHYVVRFTSQVYWSPLRTWCMNHDPHSYSDVGRSWTRAVRYLLHLDNPEKEPIPRDNFHYDKISQEEVEIMLGAPRASLLNDIRSAPPSRRPFEFVNWLVNERGHSPGEVASMIRCVMAASEYLSRLQELQTLHEEEEEACEDGMPFPLETASIPQESSLFDVSGLPSDWS